MSESPAVSAVPATAQPPNQADARKPWHAPTLRQIELKVTGFASGPNLDGDGSTTREPA